jgi:hypothetical protein
MQCRLDPIIFKTPEDHDRRKASLRVRVREPAKVLVDFVAAPLLELSHSGETADDPTPSLHRILQLLMKVPARGLQRLIMPGSALGDPPLLLIERVIKSILAEAAGADVIG